MGTKIRVIFMFVQRIKYNKVHLKTGKHKQIDFAKLRDMYRYMYINKLF